MREVTVPPVATVGDTANLTDPVWDNAEQFPIAAENRTRPNPVAGEPPTVLGARFTVRLPTA